MRYIYLFSLSILLLASCKKEIPSDRNHVDYLDQVKAMLKDSLSDKDFAQLDLPNAKITKSSQSIFYLKIPFTGIPVSEQFVLLQTSRTGTVLSGFIINLKRDLPERNNLTSYNGDFKIYHLNRSVKLESRITRGYITNLNKNTYNFRTSVVPTRDSTDLPEVIVTCYIQSGAPTDYYTWFNFSSLFGGGGGDYGSSGLYSSIENGSGGGGAGVGTVGGITGNITSDTSIFGAVTHPNDNMPGDVAEEKTILVDFEPPVENLSAIDISKYLKCFSNIPDDGSTCSIEILCDIPVDTDSKKFFNWTTGSPGHSFIHMKKSRGAESISQYFGFYPVYNFKSVLTNLPVEGKLVDNTGHEYNASLKMDVTPEQFKNSISHVLELSKTIKYDIDDYNCTDFALSVFNSVRNANPLLIPKYIFPGSVNFSGSNTPQGLYDKLEGMKRYELESNNIEIPGIKKWVPVGRGPCN